MSHRFDIILLLFYFSCNNTMSSSGNILIVFVIIYKWGEFLDKTFMSRFCEQGTSGRKLWVEAIWVSGKQGGWESVYRNLLINTFLLIVKPNDATWGQCMCVCWAGGSHVILFKFQRCLIPILSLPPSASSKMVLICYSTLLCLPFHRLILE